MTISSNVEKVHKEFALLMTQIELTRLMIHPLLNDESDTPLVDAYVQLGAVNTEAKQMRHTALNKLLMAKRRQAIQQSLFDTLKGIVSMAENKLKHDVISLNRGEYSLQNAQAGIEAALDRAENINKLLTVWSSLNLIELDDDVHVVNESLFDIKIIADAIIENIERYGSDL